MIKGKRLISIITLMALLMVTCMVSTSVVGASNPNLALNKTAYSSSNETRSFPASFAFDGNLATRWSSGTGDPQWIYVDLGANYSISYVRLFWESAYATAYTIQVSNDKTNWADVYSTTTGDGGIDEISFSAANARYVRMYGTARGTQWSYSLWEMEVYQNTYVPTPPPTSGTPLKTEVIVRTVENFKSHTDVVKFMDSAKKYNVSIVAVAVKQDEDEVVPSGTVFYNSTIATKAAGYETYDALADVITEAHARGIAIKAWIPQFHDQVAALKNPAWQMKALVNGKVVPYMGSNGEYFVSPLDPNVQNYERSIIKEIVTNYDVDGVILDWIRFDNWNMDLGDYARSQFQTAYGYDPATIRFTKDSTQRQQWQAWRTAKLGEYFAAVRSDINSIKPGLHLGAYVLPPEFVECGQDPAMFAASIDAISPMAYYDDWGYAQSWVYNTLIPQVKAKASTKEIIPTFDTDWSDAAYQDIQGNIRTKFPDITTLSFFVYANWSEVDMYKIDLRRYW